MATHWVLARLWRKADSKGYDSAMSLPSTLIETTESDVQRLIADRIQEGPHLDFKRDLPAVWNEAAKHELLADVTAFANSGGGDIIYGVAENDAAEASAVCPQSLESVDLVVRRLQDFLLNLAEPRLPGIQVHAVEVSETGKKGHVLVVRVPQSWAAPHRVKTNQHVYVREGQQRARQHQVARVQAAWQQDRQPDT